MPSNWFDSKAHKYYSDGLRMPSVTEVLSFGSKWKYPEGDYAARGTQIHHAAHLIDLGLPLADALYALPDEWQAPCEPYLVQYVRFLREVRPVMIHMEKMLFSSELWLAGTLDRFLQIAHECGVLDIKSGSIPNSVGPQTALYDRVLHGNMPDPSDIRRCRWVLQLTPKKYKLHKLTERKDYLDGLKALQDYKQAVAA